MELIANSIQEVGVNQNVLFSDEVISGNCSIIHREGSGLVTVRGLPNGQCRARFRAMFSGNIAVPEEGTPEGISIALAINGEPVQSTLMRVVPAASGDFFNVASAVYIDVPIGCCSQLSVENTSTQIIAVANANLIVERVA